ncbi:MAG: SpoIID/LytB domain-containing protein [Firmicutes bacterium]|nr:SpoIID/LytB domain-containing protein [Bacillota bacterium]
MTLLIVSCAGPEKKPEKKMQEEPSLTVFIDETGEKKEMKLEEYLAGVVAAEMDTDWPENALAAQAIVARTFTMENINNGKKFNGADATTNEQEFQAYDASRINDRVKKAVQKTRGEVIRYKGEYVKGWFSACCGGLTAGAQEGLDWKKTKTPYIKAGLEDGCMEITKEENKNWQVKIPLNKVQQAVTSTTGESASAITTAEIAQKGPSGRAVKIKMGESAVGGPALRLAVGSEEMRSTLLKDIEVEGGNLVVSGDGFGHGVGLCQWGAHKMAKEDKSPEQIVNFYYKDVEIEKLWK